MEKFSRRRASEILQSGIQSVSPKILLYAGAILIILLLTLPFAVSYTSRPEFCITCHEMRPYYQDWQKSSHRKITCVACHIEPGLINLFKEKLITSSKDIYLHFTETYKKPINVKSHLATEIISQDICLRCHSPEQRKFTPSRNVSIDHEIHKKNKIRCTYCHNRVVHKPQPKQKNFLKMTGCFRCHGLEKAARAPGKCQTCHPPDFKRKPDSHELARWAPPSLELAIPGVVYRHTRLAKADLSYCQMCHVERKLCTPCHQTKMPHQRPWADRHGKTVVAVSTVNGLTVTPSTIFCARCHQIEQFCSKCHKGAIFPHPSPWAPVHGKLAKQINKEPCYTCHRQQFCRWCHAGIKMPHQDDWLKEHFIFLRDNPIDKCLGCHLKSQCETCHSRHRVHNQHTLYDFGKPPQ